jgi:tRNA nucleotidyltransferase (CCA-adding enzyme)
MDGISCEVTTFRTDGEYHDSRKPDSVNFVSDVKDDLRRRDFTMNAIAMDSAGNIVDPFMGIEDIKNGIIRCVGDPVTRFSEDALRMLRAVRFSAQLGFEIEKNTMEAIYRCSHLVKNLSAERVRDEVLKLLSSPRPELIGELVSMGLLAPYVNSMEIDFTFLKSIPTYNNLRFFLFVYALQNSGVIADGGELISLLRMRKNDVKLYNSSLTAAKEYSSDPVLLASLTTPEVATLTSYFIGGDTVKKVKSALESGKIVREKDLAVDGSFLFSHGFTGMEIAKAKKILVTQIVQGKIRNTVEDIEKAILEIH